MRKPYAIMMNGEILVKLTTETRTSDGRWDVWIDEGDRLRRFVSDVDTEENALRKALLLAPKPEGSNPMDAKVFTRGDPGDPTFVPAPVEL